jgi:hypothetical protein
MQLSTKTLEKLRDLINETTEYRSGPKIIDFFRLLITQMYMVKVFHQDGHTQILV